MIYIVWTVWGIIKVCWSIATFVSSLPATPKCSSNPLSKKCFYSWSHNTWENKNNCSYLQWLFFLKYIKSFHLLRIFLWIFHRPVFEFALNFAFQFFSAVFHQSVLVTHHTVIYRTSADNWLESVCSLLKYLTFINIIVLGVWVTFFKVDSIHCLFLLHFS